MNAFVKPISKVRENNETRAEDGRWSTVSLPMCQGPLPSAATCEVLDGNLAYTNEACRDVALLYILNA